MTRYEGWLTRSDLLAAAAEAGLPVSNAQVVRWHKRGLIPRPEAPGLGQARGRVPYYPPGTDWQLLEALKLHRVHRDLDDVGWLLWWAGYVVSMGAIRERLVRCGVQIDTCIRQAATPDGQDLSDPTWAQIDEARTRRLPPSLGRARRRVGRSMMPTALRILIEISAGVFHGFETDPVSGEDEDQPIFLRATGLEHGQRGHNAWLPGDLGPALAEMSSLLASTSFEAVALGVPDAVLSGARDDAKRLAGRVAAGGRPGTQDILRFLESDSSPEEQAGLVTVALFFRPGTPWGQSIADLGV